MNLKKLPDRLEELQRKGIRKVRKCSYKNCGRSTAKNHGISQAMLYNMADGNYVYELGVNPWVPGMLAYGRKGIGEATVFQELCNSHDHKLFESIDQPEIELSYENLVLMAYRALLRERFKKTVKLESYGVFSDEFNDVNNGMVSEAHEKHHMFKFNLESIKWYEKALINELDNPYANFIFKVLEYPYFPIAGSELFTYEPDEITHLKRTIFYRNGVLDPFADVFLNLIPSKNQNKLIVTIGAHQKDGFLLQILFRQLKKKSIFKSLSDILCLHVEDWVCGETFYNDYLKGREGDIVKLFAASSHHSVIARSTRFNIFKKYRTFH
jgi:hypothetical protein